MSRSRVEISLARLRRNVAAIRDHLPSSTDIIAVVKANAYGHGVGTISLCLHQTGIRDFAVASIEEGIELRKVVPGCRILVLKGCGEGEAECFQQHDLTASVFDLRPLPADLNVEVKIDTGMMRLGIPWQQASGFIRQLKGQVCGVFSHFAASGQDSAFTLLQLERFLQATQGFNYRRHISDSAGLQYPQAHLDAVRLGLSLYGVSPCPEVNYVQPILCWKAHVLSVREVATGTPVGYGRTFVTRRKSRIAVLPVGYADGYNRLFSSRGQVRIRGRLLPVVGRVSMDLSMVDVTDLPEISVGEEVRLLEDDPSSPISASALAQTLGTIPYEVLTSIGSRVTRIYVEEPNSGS